MNGMILAGEAGTRLYLVGRAVSKQLLPVYDKPMNYCLLSMLQGSPRLRQLLGDGEQLCLSSSYVKRAEPLALAEPFVVCEDIIGDYLTSSLSES